MSLSVAVRPSVAPKPAAKPGLVRKQSTSLKEQPSYLKEVSVALNRCLLAALAPIFS